MKDKKTISVRKLAALESAKALGLEIKRPKISVFEHKAREWKNHEQAEKSEVQGPMSEVQSTKSKIEIKDDGSEVQSVKPGVKIEDDIEAGKANEGFDWQPQQPDQSVPENKFKDLNTASIARLARKIIAREWAMALGRGMGLENGQATIERGVEEYRKKKAVEREMKEIVGQRANKQRAAMEAALRAFGRNLSKTPRPIAPGEAEALLEEALSEVGDTIRITWHADGCHILLEPWEERRLRNKAGEPLLAVFQATIDVNLMLSSYQKIEDPQVLQQTQNALISKNIMINFRDSPRDLHAFEDAVAQGGRIIQSMKMDSGWKIKLETWAEMRRRNIERKGRLPIVTYVINADKDFNRISCERI